MNQNDLILVILAIFIPPLAMFLKSGANNDFWINLVLTLFFFLPGVIHAVYVIGFRK